MKNVTKMNLSSLCAKIFAFAYSGGVLLTIKAGFLLWFAWVLLQTFVILTEFYKIGTIKDEIRENKP